jgi:tRNA A-37 threonylcarbamoyl transferase component Bud32
MKYQNPPTGLENAFVLNVSKRGDGRHRILKIEHEGRPVVVKCYGLKRNRLRTVLRQFGSLVIVGKSSVTARARCRTERETLTLWHNEGFDVPRVYPIDFPSLEPCVAMEWIPGQTVSDFIRARDESLETKKVLIGRFTEILARRHDRALALNESRLLFEHPTLNHVIWCGDRLVHFDFEMVFTWKRDLDRLVRRELAGFIRPLVLKSRKEETDSLLEIMVRTYPEKARLRHVLNELEKFGSVPVLHRLEGFQKLAFFRKKGNTRPAAALARALKKA